LSQLSDVVITSATHNTSIKYDSTNWVNTPYTLPDLRDTNLNNVSHNDVLIWNSETSRWENGKLSSLLSTLAGVVDGIVSIKLSIYVGEQGDPAKSLCVAFTDNLEAGNTLAIASCGDNNAVYKKEPTDSTFTFLTTLNRGERYLDNLPAGTVFISDKGIAGCTDPYPTPFGVSCIADTYFRFYAFRQNVLVYATSAGRDALVTLLASDETTVVDGPHFINAYGSVILACNANDEFVITSTTDIFCGTATYTTNILNAVLDTRLIPPMRTELIVHNRGSRVTAQFADTTVTWYRQNMQQDSVTVNGGTPLTIGSAARAGTDTNVANQGWLILRSDKPISCFSGADGAGSQAIAAWPVEFLAQMFPIYSYIDTTLSFRQAGINVCSPYEGEARIYDSNRTLVFTFPYTRGTSPPATPNDQLYPAAGQSNPGTDGYATLSGGWIETTTPAVCVINFIGTPATEFGFSDNGDETLIPGTSPAELKAVIIKDPDGFLRRRDIDNAGVETWAVC
ncbi:unnamed protein product, partial [Ectocarpus sp. 6 AP-2014]